ncbi:MAG TPA: phage holin family protein [Anaerolineaceae bacterium]|nr:phage holin family protein [Anaerolineaceae bacterium]
MRLIIRLLINGLAFYAAEQLLSPEWLQPQGADVLYYLGVALVFAVVNAVIRPILMVMSCPLLIVTLGLGTLLINTLLFFLVGWIGSAFGVGFTVNGFLGAFLGSLVVSLVSFVLSLFFPEKKDRR